MKYYLAALLFVLPLSFAHVQAMDIGTDPVGNVHENGEKDGKKPNKPQRPPEHRS